MCHIILVLPLLGLSAFAFLPVDQALMLYMPVLLVSAVFYYEILRDMQRPVTLGAEGMIGALAQVIENGEGRLKVFCRGEIWEAICAEPVSRDEKVEITAIERMKLIVKARRPMK